MNKTELNNKLAEIYKTLPFIKKLVYWKKRDEHTLSDPEYADLLLIDDWDRLMDLAVANKMNIVYNSGIVMCTNDNIHLESFIKKNKTPQAIARFEVAMAIASLAIDGIEFIKDHESPQAAARYAIAMALIKLAEDK